MKDNKNKKRIFRKIALICFIFCFLYSNESAANPVIDVLDDATKKIGEKIFNIEKTAAKDDKTWLQKLWPALQKASSKAFHSALSKALNTIAYDTATWIGSGGKGQKPLFITEGWGEYMNNIGDNAAGSFIEKLGREGGFAGEKFNLCEPDFALKMQIGLGLVNAQRPKAPACTFSKMKENWDEALRSDNFLPNFQDMFNPESNDLSRALTLQTGIIEEINALELMGIKKLETNKGWLDIRGVGGEAKSYPGFSEKQVEQAEYLQWSNIQQYTGDAFIDALNIFLNQLSITAFQNLMKNIGDGKDKSTHPYNWGSLTDFEAGPSNSGVAGVENKFRELLEPKFNIRGDYNILAELTMCPDPNKAGPTNCVIDDKFSQAIGNRVTVGNAIEQGYLNTDGIFGFISDELEPSYKDSNYPYRSMIILRKFRIIPVSWELAAEYIKDNLNNINGAKSLGDLVACYDQNDEYEGYYDVWCKGLVDPNWVLKAPLNYCKREGYGPEIISEQISGEGDNSELSISRNENYCADEQSCIKENNDGSCEMYGYCAEEKRKWNFNADSCNPNYNTCQTFRSNDGKTVSYLENTLDYGICNIDNVGCKKYSVSSTGYNSDTNTIDWDGIDNMYFDKDIEECDVDSEGCYEFIRTKAGLGANLLINSSFEENLTNGNWDATGGTQNNNDSYLGKNSLELAGNLNYNYVINPIIFNYQVSGESFNLSFYAKDCGEDGEIELGLATTSLNNANNNWQYFSIFNIYPLNDSSNIINFQINGVDSGCKIDAIKLERGNNSIQYSDYRQNGLVYEKLLPDYLENDCYKNPGENYQFKDDKPTICNNFARKCNQNEADCSMYTSVDDNISIPAKVLAQDYCPEECNYYDNYLQQESIFDSLNPAYFIPKTAQICGAESTGCDEFTNLDKIEEQGEQVEYYSYLRQCRNPDNQCSDFYTWEGSSETGYQLISFNLQNNGNEPAVTEDDSLECNENIYNLPSTDPAYNSDCREFYSTTGNISYHLYKRTISCSNNCHPYRRTRNNIVKNLDNSDLSMTQCNALEGSGDKQIISGQCIFCKNGGTWNDQHQSCIYMAIPGEGVECASSADGCREYSGNSGNNIKIILNNDFEGSLQNWVSDGSINLSNNSLMVGGESLQISGGTYLASTTIGYLAEQNKSYYLTFIAKTNGASSFTNIGFNNGVSVKYFIKNSSISEPISENWKIYKFNLASLDHEINNTESLFIQADGDFFIDNIRLIEITDRYYLIKDSWNIPDSCYKDIYGNLAGETHNLGCSVYSDQDDKMHYLRQFSNLCQESAVGCELMIDTHNYNNYNSSSWNGPGDDLVDIDIDNYIYAVYDQEKECNNDDQGCSRFGKVYEYENDSVYGDIYLKNNPNKYDEILCEEEAINCNEWVSDDGTNYFKDPKDQICEWRQLSGKGKNSWNWFKKKIKYCDSDSDGFVTSSVDKLCLSNNDCDLIGLTCQNNEECGVNNVCVNGQCSYSCILDNNDYVCPINSLKTFGYGGNGSIIYQPTQDLNGYWAGICSADESGCSEYIDPISKFNINTIFNADFSQDVDNNGDADGWDGNSQNILLKPRTLYILSVENNDIDLNTTNNVFRELNNDNSLGNLTNNISISSLTNQRISKIFYVVSNDEISAIINVADSSVGNNSSVELKKAIIEYQKKQELDKETCNGIINFEDGCVLFNERVQNGLSLTDSIWDADLTVNDGMGISPDVGIESERDVNTLIKVTPDRGCNNWLACRSYIKDEDSNNVCFDIGLCDSVDNNGNCNNFVISKKINQTYPSLINSDSISNMSGYAKVGNMNSSLNSDYYSFGAMNQIGEVAEVQNGGFEFYGSNGFPIGWKTENNNWDKNKFSVIQNPISAQTEAISYPLEGKSFLKYSPSTSNIISEFIDVEPNTEYSLSAFINTKNFFSSLGFNQVAVEFRIETYDLLGNKSISNISASSNYDISECENQYQPWFNGCGFNTVAGEDWDQRTINFKIGSNTKRLKISIYGTPGKDSYVGNVYIDDIKLRPVLNKKDNQNETQTCRLYPESDSLSCEYYEDSGQKQKGWLGYCLEYDRYPGNKDACLLWYPIDKVKGEGIEEGAGYSGRLPVYYTVADNYINYSENLYKWTDNGGCDLGHNWQIDANNFSMNMRDKLNKTWIDKIIIHGAYKCELTELENWKCMTPAGYYAIAGNATFDSDGVLTKIFADWKDGSADPCKYFTILYPEIIFKPIPDKKIIQTVTPLGQNKYWSGRVYKGSSFEMPCNVGMQGTSINVCSYSTDYIPFGSLVSPATTLSELSNPYEWDSKTELDKDGNDIYPGIQPLYYEEPDLSLKEPYQARMGQVHKTNSIKRIFAQSYGAWNWNGNRYVPVEGFNWGPPQNACANGVRPPYVSGSEADICANPPQVVNIKVNNLLTNNVNLNKNGFINITFNSKVDSQQLPLIMYAIDWGDNEKTVVSGVEMRERSNINNPHLVYHLYSYWDLKSKNSYNQGLAENMVYCGDAGNVPQNYNNVFATGVSCPINNNCCAIKPGVKIKDNWGWCNNGVTNNICPVGGHESFNNWIVVTEN